MVHARVIRAHAVRDALARGKGPGFSAVACERGSQADRDAGVVAQAVQARVEGGVLDGLEQELGGGGVEDGGWGGEREGKGGEGVGVRGAGAKVILNPPLSSTNSNPLSPANATPATMTTV